MKIKKCIDNLSIKAKLIVLAVFALLLISGILVAVVLNYSKMATAVQLKDNINGLSEKLLQARISEKSYLQFYNQKYIDMLQISCAEASEEVEGFLQSVNHEEQRKLLEKSADLITDYSTEFGSMVSINKKKEEMMARMDQAFQDASAALKGILDTVETKQYELTLEGEELSYSENLMLLSARDCNAYLLTAKSMQKTYVADGEKASYSAFYEYLTGDALLTVSALETITKSVGEVSDISMPELASEFQLNSDKYKAAAEQYHNEFSKEIKTAEQLDAIGTQVRETAGDLIASATRMADDAKASAITVIAVCLVVGSLLFVTITGVIILSITKPLALITLAAECLQKGDLSSEVTYESTSEIGQLADAFRKINQTLRELVKDMQHVAEAAAYGRLDERADTTRHQGAYGDLAIGVNDIIDRLVNFIDNLPLPVLTMSCDFDVLYMNEAGIGLLGSDLSTIKGEKCYDCFRTSDCRTGECACGKAMESGESAKSETDAHPRKGLDLDIAYSGIPLKNSRGDVVGALEIVQDMTAIKKASRLSEKQAVYQNGEVNRLVDFMEEMAMGVLDSQLSIAVGDGDTRDAHENFTRISVAVEALRLGLRDKALVAEAIARGDLTSTITLASESDALGKALQTMVAAISQLVADANQLAGAAVAGRLETRADTSVHQGDFRKVVEGINDTLNAVMVPLKEVGNVLQAAAEGDLTTSVEGDYQGQLATLKENVNKTISSLHQTLSEVMSITQQVYVGSSQINEATQSLSEGATTQASSLEEISSSMHEVAAQTKTNAENATQARTLTSSANDAASAGSGQMTQMVEAMNAINESSQQIAKIIKVIDDIAFQTNLLALNAAVEAARAGRHGKGFAVVADEVRNLAGRSAKAAKETADLIESSGSKVQNGLSVASSTSASFVNIVDTIVKATNLVGEIADASDEQAKGVVQINLGLQQVDQVTQQNTAHAEETASAVTELSQQATQLQEMINHFKLEKVAGKMLVAPPVEGFLSRTSSDDSAMEWGEGGSTSSDEGINLDDDEFGKY